MRIQKPASAYDVVIIGGGMVGASFACALRHALKDVDVSILVIESFSPTSMKTSPPSFDARSTALSYGTSQIYSNIGLWQQLSSSATSIKEIQISDKGRFGSARITSEEQRVEALGFVIENQALGICLNSELDKSDELQFLCPAAIQKIIPEASGMSLELEVESKQHFLSAKLVVLADGGKSSICEQLGIKRDITSYEQQALIANVAFEKPHHNIAFERFTDTGPLAVLPLASMENQNRCSLVWTLNAQQVDEYQSLSADTLKSRLQERFGNKLGRVLHIGERFCYPLTLAVAKEQIRPGLVLLGNVAHTLHPVAGQGLNLAMRDVEMLAITLRAALHEGKSPGSMQVLQQYLQVQQADQDRAIGFTDYATKLFSSNSSAKVMARKFGLLSVDLVPSLRRELAKHAMGLATRRQA